MIFLVRHCESEGNVDPMVYFNKPDHEIDLTPKGKEHAQELVRTLASRLDQQRATNITCYCSNYLRAKNTAKPFVDHLGLPLVEDPLIRERNWGDLRIKVANKEHTDDDFGFFVRHPNGESFQDLHLRVCHFFSYLREKHTRFDTVVVFTHGEWMKMAKMIITSQPVAEFEKTCKVEKIPNGEIVKLSY